MTGPATIEMACLACNNNNKPSAGIVVCLDCQSSYHKECSYYNELGDKFYCKNCVVSQTCEESIKQAINNSFIENYDQAEDQSPVAGQSSATQPPVSASSAGSISSAPQSAGQKTYRDKQYYLSKIKSTDPAHPDQPVPQPPPMEEKLKTFTSQQAPDPNKPFDGCPEPLKESPKNNIVRIDCISRTNVAKRRHFHVLFPDNKWRWIDLAILVKLEPAHIWRDYIRGLYAYNGQLRAGIINALDRVGVSELRDKVIDSDVIKYTIDASNVRPQRKKKT